MNKKETEVILQRIQNWYGRLPSLFIYDEKKFEAKFGWSKEPTKFEDRLSLDYKPINEEESWGENGRAPGFIWRDVFRKSGLVRLLRLT